MSIIGDPAGTFPGGGDSQYKINSIYDIHPLVLGDLAAYFTANPFPIPANQVTGFDTYQPQAAPQISTDETTTSTTYTNLATVGPQILSLAAGTYKIDFGCIAYGPNSAKMNVEVDGSALDPADANFCSRDSANQGSMSRSIQVSVTRQVVAKYLSGVGGTVHFANRWMSVQKVSN